MQETTCCFIGHREINESEYLPRRLLSVIKQLILTNKVDTFLFGSKSRFNRLCYEQVTILKEKYPHIKRVYVRAEFPVIDEQYIRYLLERYEDTYYPEQILGTGKAVYLLRNRRMIDESRYCVIYCEEGYAPRKRKSGTKMALEYAVKKEKKIITLP